jgi:hypothetical protein
MADIIFDPIQITYRGLYADQHLVDAPQYGRSLIGVNGKSRSHGVAR